MSVSLSDPRIKKLIEWLDSFFPKGSYKPQKLICKPVALFFDTDKASTLEFCLMGENDLKIQTKICFPKDCLKEVYLIKIGKKTIENDKIYEQIKLGSFLRTPGENFLHELKSVYSPLFSTSKIWGEQLNPKVKNLILTLEDSLRQITLLTDFSTPMEEIHSIRLSKYLKSAVIIEYFNKAFKEYDTTFVEAMENLFSKKLIEMVRDVQTPFMPILIECLNDVWLGIRNKKDQYPEERMKNMLDSISHYIYRYIVHKLSELGNVFTGQYVKIRDHLEMAIEIIKTWINFFNVTENEWKKSQIHPWNGEKYSSKQINVFLKRLMQILQIRKTNQNIFNVLGNNEKKQEFLKDFANCNPLYLNENNNVLWNNCLKNYNSTIVGLETELTEKLMDELNLLKNSPHKLLVEYKRNMMLLQRKNVFQQIKPQREELLTILEKYLKENLLKEFITIKNESQTQTDDNLLMNSIIYSKNIEEKIYFLILHAKGILKDLPEFKKFFATIQTVLKKLKAYCNGQFNLWKKLISMKIENFNFTLKGIVKIEDTKDGNRLKINFEDKTILPMRSIMKLSALIKDFPPDLVQQVNRFKEYYSYVNRLKQIAHYANSIYVQILECTRDMLRETTVDFERTIYEYESNLANQMSSKSCEAFINKLREVAFKLSQENQKIRSQHDDIGNKMVDLININLLLNKEEWVQKFEEIKKIIIDLDKSGYKYMSEWKSHWNHQLYKCLEYQYQLGLESLNEGVPEIKVRLVFQGKRLQYNPSIPSIKHSYFKQMKDFISFPSKFNGFGDTNIFQSMLEKNYLSLKIVYQKATTLFSKLEIVKRKYSTQTILGIVDLEKIIEENFTEVRDWERTHVICEKRMRQVRNINETISIDCVTINLEDFKLKLEDQLNKLKDILISTLQKNTRSHLKNVAAYIEDSSKLFDIEPHSLDEIYNCRQSVEKLEKDKIKISKEFEEYERKNSALRYIAKLGIDPEEVKDDWGNFEDKIMLYKRFLTQKQEGFKKDVQTKENSFKQEMRQLEKRWRKTKPSGGLEFQTKKQADEEVEKLKEFREEFNEILQKKNELANQWKLFGEEGKMNSSEYNVLNSIERELKNYEKYWEPYTHFYGEIQDFCDEEWVTFKNKIHKFEDFMHSQNKRLKEHKNDSIVKHLSKELAIYNKFRQYTKFLLGVGWTAEHWLQLGKIIGIKKLRIDQLKFGELVEKADVIVEKLKDIQYLNSQAIGEDTLRKALRELKTWENTHEFEFMLHKEAAYTTPLIKEWKDVLSKVGDNYALLTSLKDSKFISMFVVEVSSWEEKILKLDEYLRFLMRIQRKWIYLSPIFGRGSLPTEQHKFNRADTSFREIMNDIFDEKRVVKITKFDILDKLKRIQTQLDSCQKALNDFLEKKRQSFPRFYFIGDEDLLEILGQSTNPKVIQNHLKKLFAGISHVKFDEHIITHMCSSENEEVKLTISVQTTENVEEWLLDLDKNMVKTLETLLCQCVNRFDMDAYPEQILSVTTNINFTEAAEKAIKSRNLNRLRQDTQSTLEKYTEIDTSKNHLLELKIKSLMFDITHNIDVIDHLIKNNVRDINDWNWQKQLRYYLVNDKCVVRMCSAEFNYSYEYHGNKAKLVYTPLTDKCYLTLTQALHLGFGGNPYGPAGTGKTESVKALGVLLGRQVLVFNCDEGIDFQSMGRIFIGLVKCGAWGCFDEFNRLKEDQLSTISQQIQVIQAGIKGKKKFIELLGHTVDVNLNAGIFVTMNPVSKKYGARSKLPGNLKQLFRSVAMSRPDVDLIARVMLYCEGFKNGDVLSKKIVAIFQLCKERLSPQQHYDWGLRALKTVLRIGGSILKKTKQSERDLLIQALRVNTIPKLTYKDAILFDEIIRDVFPGIIFSEIQYKNLEKCIKEVLKEEGLAVLPSQIRKLLQFYEGLNQRMGVVLVGPSGSGKSTVWKVLNKALIKMGKNMKKYVVNPKSISREELLGYMDEDTREFSDGIITSNARKVVNEKPDVSSWIICDGDIDPKWIEALNSVLDDNKLLTMPTGERIQFGNNVNFVFETHSLKYASPATVSRMGMIFMSEKDMDLRKLVDSWLLKQKNSNHISALINNYYFKCVERIMEYKENLVVDATEVGIAISGLSQLKHVKKKGEFVIGMIRGLGSYLELEERVKFAKEVFEICESKPVDYKRPLDCYFDSQKGKFEPYEFSVKNMSYEGLFDNPLVRTVEVQRNIDTLLYWLRNGDPFLIVGPIGAGISTLLHNCFQEMGNISSTTIFCNSRTSSNQIIKKILQNCQSITKNNGKVLIPKEGDLLVVFIRDLNIPKPDKYGTTQLISFLQQIITYNGFYDKELEWISLENIQFVCSMKPTSSMGTHDVTSRFTSIVRVFYLPYPEQAQLRTIYTEITKIVFRKKFATHQTWKNRENVTLLVNATLNIYALVRAEFSLDDYSHYIFTPKDITSWILGILKYNFNDKAPPSELLNIWIYEGRRIFRDKLVDSQSKLKYLQIEMRAMSNIKTNLDYSPPRDLYFTTLNQDDKLLQKVELKKLAGIIKEITRKYERENREIGIPMLTETIDYITSVDRVLSQENGNLLLCGSPGIGRKSFVNLVCNSKKLLVHSPKTVLNYSIKSFKIDLKYIAQVAGVEGKECCFLLEDHLLSPKILEFLNGLLNGEVSGLYKPEELDQVLMPLSELLSQQGEYGSIYSFFVKRLKKNMRVCISMDPSSKNFDNYTQSNPALFTNCQILWKVDWEKAGYNRIPKVLLPDDILKSVPLKIQDTIQLLVKLHETTKSIRSTPVHFKNFLEMFKSIIMKFQKGKKDELQHLINGLSKIEETEEKIDTLSKETKKRKILLDEKKAEAKTAMNSIQINMQQAIEEQNNIKNLKEKIEVENKILVEKSSQITENLERVQPLLEEAKNAVSNISNADLVEIRGYAMPRQEILDVFEGVILVMGRKDTRLNAMKKFLGEKGVKKRIINLDPRKVSNSVFSKVRKHLSKTKSSFQNAASVSRVAGTLGKWLEASVKYVEVIKKVGPWEKERDEIKTKNEVNIRKLEDCEKKLKELNSSISGLKDNFEKKTNEAVTLQADLEKVKKKLDSALDLLGKLSNEKKRWREERDKKQKTSTDMPYFSVLSAAFISYLGGEPEVGRKKFVETWKKLLKTKSKFDLRSFISNEKDLLQFNQDGLPGDKLSQENALIILNSKRYPLIVDPSQQATSWLQNTYKKVEITNSSDPKFQNKLELAIRFGKILIINEVDSIGPILYPLLKGEMFTHGTRKSLVIGEKFIDYNQDFKLFLVTRNPSLELPPDAEAIVNRVNFTVTKSGLEEQLLNTIFNEKYPDLEKQKKMLLKQEEESKLQLLHLEKNLLDELANSEGSLLENVDLIDSLNGLKKNSDIINQKLKESAKNKRTLLDKMNKYRSLAECGSSIFFLIQDLSKLHGMYQFSLEKFLGIYSRAIKQKTEDVAVLIQELVVRSYHYVSRSLFKKDRLIFAMHLIYGLDANRTIQKSEWEFFLGSLIETKDVSSVQVPQWIPAHRTTNYQNMASLLGHIEKKLDANNSQKWKPWINLSVINDTPSGVELTPFQKIIVIQTTRPDQLYQFMSKYACRELGIESISPPPMNFLEIYKRESNCNEPILLITTPGTDPSLELEDTAAKILVKKDGFQQLAMGQGVQEKAIRMLHRCAEKGEWLYLKNLHLVISWVPQLEKELSMLRNVNENFRLWLSTEPHDHFSVILLHKSMKITFESPPGIKQNLLKTVNDWNNEFFAKSSLTRARLLFTLACFHGIVQERRTYVPQGWSKAYEITPADLRGATDIIESAISNNEIDWKTIHGLFENVIYGGRIDNPFDIDVLRAYLHNIFSQDSVSGRRNLFGNVRVIAEKSISAALEKVQMFPDNDSPSMFGLSENADRVLATINGGVVADQLLSLSLTSELGGGGNKSGKDGKSKQILSLVQFWQKLCSGNMTILFTPPEENEILSKDPIKSFLQTEFENALSLVRYLNKCFQDLEEIMAGKKLMTAEMNIIKNSLLTGGIPLKWDDRWEDGPQKIQKWLDQVVKKTLNLSKLVQKQSVLGESIDMSHLFNPNVFLNAFKQKVARDSKVPLDNLNLLSCDWSGRRTGVKVSGLKIQGARMQGEKLVEVENSSPSLLTMGTISLNWIKNDNLIVENMLAIPVYFTPKKTRVLTKLYLKCSEREKNKWVLQGVSVFVNE